MATGTIKRIGLTKTSKDLLSTVRETYSAITSDSTIYHTQNDANKNIINLQIKSSSAITSGAVQLSGIPFPGSNAWGALASSDGKVGWVQMSSDGKLYIRCQASSSAYMAGQVVY